MEIEHAGLVSCWECRALVPSANLILHAAVKHPAVSLPSAPGNLQPAFCKIPGEVLALIVLFVNAPVALRLVNTYFCNAIEHIRHVSQRVTRRKLMKSQVSGSRRANPQFQLEVYPMLSRADRMVEARHHRAPTQKGFYSAYGPPRVAAPTPDAEPTKTLTRFEGEEQKEVITLRFTMWKGAHQIPVAPMDPPPAELVWRLPLAN
eukprot:TRINITY_DN688_c0_g1_i2.p1 TRINITY_DN688_c0_g1~~TRINITY_DN688_c0_g1_i2.p1  ORF type:complete len:213 (+),score=30.17 TRINITY_DN688_c0_g1_i2:25-639(+)